MDGKPKLEALYDATCEALGRANKTTAGDCYLIPTTHIEKMQEAVNALFYCEDKPEETDINAALIAAAPDLLAACEGALFSFEYLDAQSDFDWNSKEIKQLRAAIAKAKGQ